MIPVRNEFEYDYHGSTLMYGRGSIEEIGSKLNEYGLEDALVVTGSNVGANPDVMEPVTEGLGECMGAVFDQTTPQKHIDTAYDGIELIREKNPDVLVGVGGGSSLDIARQMSVMAADGRSLTELCTEARAGKLSPPVPDEPPIPVVIVPTTFAGADISDSGSLIVLSAHKSPTGQPAQIGGSVAPELIIYDPALFETTPFKPLAGSAINGFNKGIETLYARNTTPITDATAVRGLQFLHRGLPHIGDDSVAMERAVVGIMLVQFERQTSIVHAFGHGFSRRYDVQQGKIHAITVPHVLRYVFKNAFANRTAIAEGLGIETNAMTKESVASEIITEVEAIRDSLGLPSRLRELDPTSKEDLSAIAQFIINDSVMANAPVEFNPSIKEIEEVLSNAW